MDGLEITHCSQAFSGPPNIYAYALGFSLIFLNRI